MIFEPNTRGSRPARWFLYGIATMSLGVLPAAGQQSDQLQEQLKQLKQQYETTTHELEQRINALEQQIDKEKTDREKQAKETPKEGTVSATNLAAQQVAKAVMGNSNQVGGKFQGQLPQEPTYDFLKEADVKISKLEEQANA